MYRQMVMQKTKLKVNESYEGETLEVKIQRLKKNKEPLDGSVPLTYTERSEGVKAEYNIRSDRFEIAAEAMDTYARSKAAQRDNKPGKVKDMEGKDVTTIDKPTGTEGGESKA